MSAFFYANYCNIHNTEYNTWYKEIKESVHMSIDDYLDLLNYAIAINDEQWQADLLDRLKNYKELAEAQKQVDSVRELWSRFDHINFMLLQLFDKLRDHEDDEVSDRWKEQIWELKMERITVAKQIQDRYIKIR
jgi:hypothetical protein